MANQEHLELLRQGVEAWNAWRAKERSVLLNLDLRGANLNETDLLGANLNETDLRGANLSRANLNRAYLRGADLRGTDLRQAMLYEADLRLAWLYEADLREAKLNEADLREAILRRANLNEADLSETDLSGADLREANLNKASLLGANLNEADLSGADLRGASLRGANLASANLRGANLRGANLNLALLVETDLVGATLTGCSIYGISAWDVKLSEGTEQQNLVITRWNEPQITTDDLEVAQFIYLMLHNEKLQRVIDTITSKVVLILGRFSLPERKEVLDALRDELRKRNYIPVVFDFEKPRSQTTVNTIVLLARMARFVIADISDAKSVLQELDAIVPSSPKLPVQPIIVAGQGEPGMFDAFEAYPWFLKVHRYDSPKQLLSQLRDHVIAPAEAAVAKLRA